MLNIIKSYKLIMLIHIIILMNGVDSKTHTAKKESDELPYFKFIYQKGNDVFINVRVITGQKTNAVPDLDKYEVTIQLTTKGNQREINRALTLFLGSLLKIYKPNHVFIDGDDGDRKVIKIPKCRLTPYSILLILTREWTKFDLSDVSDS
ncbi:uncharacterized protein LOC142321925 isoform X2 [Lycorma delicatula]|uniref:uncharacterized protein LOC142321925 isoform X2 n=1 Tax=Lycorma delicatula TaxID=130591 RepID=UPI003F514703